MGHDDPFVAYATHKNIIQRQIHKSDPLYQSKGLVNASTLVIPCRHDLSVQQGIYHFNNIQRPNCKPCSECVKKCIQHRLRANNFTNIELYMDIWRSMNHRFHQRQIDPRVDLTKVSWSAFHATDWLMPLLTHLNDWREKMKEIEKNMGKIDRNLDITFVADFPGLTLENYISEDLNATIEVLNGQINVEIMSVNHTLNVGDKMKVSCVEGLVLFEMRTMGGCRLFFKHGGWLQNKPVGFISWKFLSFLEGIY